MPTTEKYHQLASENSLDRAMAGLRKNGVEVFLVNNRKEARKKAIELISYESEVMTMASVTLAETGIDIAINGSPDYRSIRNRLMDTSLGKMEKQRIWAAHDWAVGSVHAITEDGVIVVASVTWSQLPAYAYWAHNVLWVVWTQKIVKDLDEAIKRIYEYVLPLENERAMKAYGTGSWVNKLLIVNKEVKPERLHMILVKESLWF